MFGIRETHLTSPIFTNPNHFDPSRWNSKTMAGNDQHYHYLPFGEGSHVCAGKETVKIILETFLIELVNGCDWVLLNENTQIKYTPSAFAIDRLPIIVEKCISA